MTVPRTVPTVHWPVVELLFEPGEGHELTVLVRALAEHCRPTAPDHTVTGAARLVSSPYAPEAVARQRQHRLPYGVVVRTADEVTHPVSETATVLVALTPEAAEVAEAGGAGERLLTLSPHALRAREVLPVMPALRAAMRRVHRLPSDLVVSCGRPGAPRLEAEDLATALRLAAAIDVVGPLAVEALALGAPVVTDAATAELLGAEPNVHVVVANAGGSAEEAARLAADPLRAARLARAGRQLVETRHDADRTASELVDRLCLPRPSHTPAAPGLRLGERLAELGTPTGHPIELQFADRLASLGVAPRTAGSLR